MKTLAKLVAATPLLAATLVLCACGGSTIEASVGGTMAGLSGGTSAVLVNNGSDPITVAGNGTFTFDQQIGSGSAYSVTVQTQPIGETCLVTNGSGTIDSEGDDVTTVTVTCYATGTQPAAVASSTGSQSATN